MAKNCRNKLKPKANPNPNPLPVRVYAISGRYLNGKKKKGPGNGWCNKPHHHSTREIDYMNMKSKVVEFVVNAGMNVTANNFSIIKSRKEIPQSEVFALLS